MEFIYVLIHGSEWEDIIIFLSEEDGINESLKYPTSRVEVFSKMDNSGLGLGSGSGFGPTYNYYKNGVYIKNGI